MCLSWFYFLLKKVLKKDFAWEWANQAIGIFLSLFLGFSIFLVQKDITDYKERKAMRQTAIKEIQLVIANLEAYSAIEIPHPCIKDEKTSVNFSRLPYRSIEVAIESGLFKPSENQHLIILRSFIEEHNIWASQITEILTTLTCENFDFKIKINNTFRTVIDNQILAKARFLSQCLITGTSNVDPDCE